MAMATPTKVRVMVVDDSVVIRKILTDVLNEDPDIEVVGTASNGVIALRKLPLLNPDLVTLDLEMPEMGGLETLKKIRHMHPRLPVVIFSSLTQQGAAATLDALSLGASDYVTKPANVGSVLLGIQAIREELVPKVRALTGLDRRAPSSGDSPAPIGSRFFVPHPVGARAAPRRPLSGTDRVAAVVIGSSTGGPNALATIWGELAPSLNVPILLVQHMPLPFTTLLAERLDRLSAIHTVEAVDNTLLAPGMCALAPGGRHMVVERTHHGDHARLNDAPPENSCRPSVDPLFVSAARVYGAGVLAIVLTGMGSDGTIGARAVRAAGGQVIVQDEATSVIWGMPGAVVAAGLADAILPLGRIANEINRRVAVRRLASKGV
jgi:two-component system, chemotaxis family, protein-glutamate methylesterase/glutaminase